MNQFERDHAEWLRGQEYAEAYVYGQTRLAIADAAMSRVTIEMEEDGRFIASLDAIPGCDVYGATEMEARRKCAALALRAMAERIENDEVLSD